METNTDNEMAAVKQAMAELMMMTDIEFDANAVEVEEEQEV
jgi:hypothetical protein